MEVIVDSHALFWFLTGNDKLSPRAKRVIENARKVIVPSIVIMEILYILQKHNLTVRFIEFLAELKSRNYLVYPLDLDIIAQTVTLDSTLEMHDRIIVATATLLDVPLVTKDSVIKQLYRKIIW